jgi:hypothetical protein
MNHAAGENASPDPAPVDRGPTEAAGTEPVTAATAPVAEPDESAPPAIEDDEDVIDAEIVESPLLTPATYGNPEAYGSLPAPDYSEAGVPSLDYVRDKIENRFGTAVGGAELAQAAADREARAKAAAEERAYQTADEQRRAREQAAKDKLDEIRRSLNQDPPRPSS